MKTYMLYDSTNKNNQVGPFEGEPAGDIEETDTSSLDVLIVEGEQLRYGNKDAWLQ